MQHLRSTSKSTSTSPCDSETPTTTKDNPMHDPTSATSVDESPEPTYKAMIHCHDKLVTADYLTISGVLLSREFIPEEIHNKMLGTNFTSQEKATIVVNTVTDKIKIAPKQFDELIKIFSEQMCTKDI